MYLVTLNNPICLEKVGDSTQQGPGCRPGPAVHEITFPVSFLKVLAYHFTILIGLYYNPVFQNNVHGVNISANLDA